MTNSPEVNDARKRVLELARDIENLSKSAITPGDYFPQFLEKLVSALGASAGAVWTVTPEGQLGLSCDVRLADIGFFEDPRAAGTNQKLLSEVMQTGQAMAYGVDDPNVELPTEHVVILAAIQLESDSLGVVQIFQRPDAPAESRSGFLQFVEQMSGYASRYLQRQQQAGEAKSPEQFWGEFEQFTLQLQRSLDVKEVAATVASDGRLLLNCDRASVAFRRGKKITIAAISGQDAVNPRANLVRAMVKIASKVMDLGEPIVYAGKVDDFPPQIEEPLASYIQESGSRMVMLVPLLAAEPLVTADDDDAKRKKKAKKPEIIGCFVVENVADSELPDGLAMQTKLVADHSAASLSNARTHQRVLFLRTLKFFGKILEWFHGRKLAKTVAVLTLVAAIVLAMVFIPWDYRIEGKGKLMPVIQQDVFCPMDGKIEKIFPNVRSGLRVEKGAVLFLLRNDEVTKTIVELESKLNELRQKVIGLRAQRQEARQTSDDKKVTDIDGDIMKSEAQIRGAIRQLGEQKKRQEKLTVRAPISGTIATFQIRKLLLNRPVKRGDKLIEIMEDRGEWRLELEVDEQRMGHLLEAQKKLNKKQLDVEFILATAAESTFDGRLGRMASRTNTAGEDGNIVEIFVTTDDVNPSRQHRRIGAEVRAKINCGKRSLGYVLFGDVVEFAQKYFWL